MKKRKNNKIFITFLGFLLIVCGITLYCRNNYANYYYELINNLSIDNYFLQSDQEIIETDYLEEDKEIITKVNNSQLLYNYIGVLEIPSINLKRGFLDANDKNNTVNKNIQLISPSDMPDVKSGNLILAAHSGNSRVSFFKNLYKLQLNSEALIYYNNIIYTYQLINIYEVEKTGNIEVDRDYSTTSLVLITCNKFNKQNQVVYVFNQVGEEIIGND